MNTEKMGGRKFILALMALSFLMMIFWVMYFKNYLSADKCMQFVHILPIIVGLFVGGNMLEHYIKNKGGKK